MKTKDTNEHTLYSCLHDSGLMADVSFIKSKKGDTNIEKELSSLKLVLKVVLLVYLIT